MFGMTSSFLLLDYVNEGNRALSGPQAGLMHALFNTVDTYVGR